ncbi:hypothetical protein EXIGLDRAFT_763918 [Exidia glandulosa HHB12029]|uniref:RNI-like protein n=1 Tax=Exidia glandulosa HHB12029 TaxID=1314781 RepID=A0A165LME6_EXIGL|nr:hypothetical protein EXIGLDRAFT_763918 [Exidia glandulosa HHB12029]
MSTCLSALNADILDLLCNAVRTAEPGGLEALKTLSMTSRQMRAAALSRVFSAVRVQGTMRKCTEVMREILSMEGLAGYIRKFTLKLDVTEDVLQALTDLTALRDPANIAARLAASPDGVACAAALLKLLSHIRLQSLNIVDPAIASSESVLSRNLKSATGILRLDSVVELSTLSCCTALSAICPSVARLSLTGSPSSEQVQIWGAQTRVECLTVRGIRDLESVQAMTGSMQHLTELTVKDRMEIRTELPRLAHLRSLRVLALGCLSHLYIGYHPPQCGFGWGELRCDPARMENLRAQRGRALNEAKRLARSVFPRLEKLHIDGVVFDFSRLKTGDFDELDALEVDSE